MPDGQQVQPAQPAQLAPVYLSQDEQGAILSTIGRQGWIVVGGAAVPEQKMGQDIAGRPQMVNTGRYTITVGDGRGNFQPVVIRPGNPDEQGNRTWLPDEVPKVEPKAEGNLINRPDGSVYRVNPDNTVTPVLGPGGKSFGVTSVGTNTTDKYIVTVDQNTGDIKTDVPNPNYVPPRPGVVATNTTDEFIVLQDPNTGVTYPARNPNYVPPKPGQLATNTTDKFLMFQDPRTGKISSQQNPNYVAPRPTTIATDTTSPFIVQQDPITGQFTNVPNPNYRPQPTTVAGNTTDPFILQRNPTTGAIEPLPNPNYQRRPPGVVATDTTSQFIVRQDPITGEVSQVPNPNYQQRPPQVVATDTTSPFIVRQDPTTGEVSQVANPNYVAPRPTVVSTGVEQPYITTMDAQGNLQSVPNPSYTPKTQADVANRVAQLQQQAQAQRDQLAQQVQSGVLTQDQANSQFNQWWQQNVEAQKPGLQAAQQQVAFEQQRQLAETQRANLQTAQTAGQQAINAYQVTLPYQVGPNFDQTINQIAGAFASGKMPGKLDMTGAFSYQMPDVNQMAQQATADALKSISPMAAGIAGAPMPQLPQNVDIAGLLNQTSYAPGGTTTTVSPSGAVTVTQGGGQQPGQADWYAQWQQRQAADVAQQRAAATTPYGPPGPQMPFWSPSSGGVVAPANAPQPAAQAMTSYQIPGLQPGLMPGGQPDWYTQWQQRQASDAAAQAAASASWPQYQYGG